MPFDQTSNNRLLNRRNPLLFFGGNKRKPSKKKRPPDAVIGGHSRGTEPDTLAVVENLTLVSHVSTQSRATL